MIMDGYLKNNQISNVTVLVNEEDLRHNGNSKVELKGELTAMIVSDEDGNYSVKDLDYDSVSMNMSTTIDDVKLTDEQIQEYVEILAETTTQMQTVYDNFGFDIKLHKEEKEMKDLSIRKWECRSCTNINERDINASMNIMFEGIKKYMERINELQVS